MKKKNLLFVLIMLLGIMLLSACAGVNEDGTKDESIQKDSEEAVSNHDTNQNVTAGKDAPEKDKAIPEYKLSFLDGSQATLSEYKGKVVIISFFTTWCTYCQKELPELEKLSQEMDDLAVIGIDVGEESSAVSEFVKQLGVTFPVHCDTKEKLSSLFLVNGFPTMAFISPEGIYLGVVPGYVEEKQMLEFIDYARTYKVSE